MITKRMYTCKIVICIIFLLTSILQSLIKNYKIITLNFYELHICKSTIKTCIILFKMRLHIIYKNLISLSKIKYFLYHLLLLRIFIKFISCKSK
jgi:hypothetical protein